MPLIRTAISQLDDEEGWVSLGRVGQRLAILASDFDPRTFGHAKLSSLVEKTGAFDLRATEGRHMQIRTRASGGEAIAAATGGRAQAPRGPGRPKSGS